MAMPVMKTARLKNERAFIVLPVPVAFWHMAVKITPAPETTLRLSTV